jgi:predicted O-methyltransferase YrrM
MGDADREAGHELANQLSAILALADLERKRAERAGGDGQAFASITELARKAASHADVIAAGPRDKRYLAQAQGVSEPLLRELEELCERDGIPLVDRETARFLSVMVNAMLASSILELGTAYGYSALCMARAQPETGRIWTIDPDKRRIAIARSFFERAGVADRIEIIDQPALAVLPKLAQRQYDIVFIDALKEEYGEYLRLTLPHVKRSGLVIVDNLLWHHRVALPEADTDEESTKSIRRFNREFLSHPDLNAVILPIGDGVGVGAKTR